MNLVRAGHLHTPVGAIVLMAENGDCSAAKVVHVNEDGTVNLSVNDHMGLSVHGFGPIRVMEKPTKEDLADPRNSEDEPENTFHLSTECPWER